jgi:hypothetical protein
MSSTHLTRRGRRVLAVVLASLFVALGTGVVLTAEEIHEEHAEAAGKDKRTGRPDPTSSGHASPTHSVPSPTHVRPSPPVPSPIPGYLLIADRGNNRMLLVGSDKRILWQYPRPGVTPRMPFYFDDDTFFGAQYTQIISQQEEQQTIQMISFPQGISWWHYGHVNVRGSGPGFLSTPDDAYLLPDGTRTVADVRNCRVLYISPAGKIVKQYGTTGVCGHDPPRMLTAPNGDTPLPNGGVIITEINGSWVDGIGKNGRLMWAVHAPVAYPSDAQWLGHRELLLADYSSPGHVLIMRTDGTVLWEYGPSSGPAALDHPSLALALPNGLIAVNDDYRHRVVLISRATKRIVWQYGHTDLAGTAPGSLNTPDGMDFLPFGAALKSPSIRRVVAKSFP